MNARRNTAEGDRLDALVSSVETWEARYWPLGVPEVP
jgi:HTH-type transcriptional regulator / antitoxin HigA